MLVTMEQNGDHVTHVAGGQLCDGWATYRRGKVSDEDMGLKALAMQIACTFPHNSKEQDLQIAEYVVEALVWLYPREEDSEARLAVVS